MNSLNDVSQILKTELEVIFTGMGFSLDLII